MSTQHERPPLAGASVAIGGALAAVGGLLPWATVRTGFGSLSVSGTEEGGDGIIMLVLGIATLLAGLNLMGVLGKIGERTAGGAILLSVLMGALAVYHINDISDKAGEVSNALVDAGPGSGLYVALVGAAVAFFGGIGMRKVVRERKAQASDVEASGGTSMVPPS